MSLFVGTDIGGTFTDVVGYDSSAGKLIFGKKLTNRGDLVEGAGFATSSRLAGPAGLLPSI